MQTRKAKKVAPETRLGYIDITTFRHHLGPGNDPAPSRIYGSKELVLKGQECSKDCGIYEVLVTVNRVVKKPSSRTKVLTEKQAQAQQLKQAEAYVEEKKNELFQALGYWVRLVEENKQLTQARKSSKRSSSSPRTRKPRRTPRT